MCISVYIGWICRNSYLVLSIYHGCKAFTANSFYCRIIWIRIATDTRWLIICNSHSKLTFNSMNAIRNMPCNRCYTNTKYLSIKSCVRFCKRCIYIATNCVCYTCYAYIIIGIHIPISTMMCIGALSLVGNNIYITCISCNAFTADTMSRVERIWIVRVGIIWITTDARRLVISYCYRKCTCFIIATHIKYGICNRRGT